MKIDFVRTGGFAGLRLARTFDSAQLPVGQASKLAELVGEAAFFELPEPVKPEKAIPDSYEYRISITTSTQSRALVIRDGSMPDQLRPLINYLVSLVKLGDQA